MILANCFNYNKHLKKKISAACGGVVESKAPKENKEWSWR